MLGQQTDNITVSSESDCQLSAYLLFLKVVSHWLHLTVWSTTDIEILMF